MGKLLRAGTGIWLGLWLMGQAPTLAAIPGLDTLRADIGAARPTETLLARLDAGWDQLLTQKGTEAGSNPGNGQAHTLQFRR